MKVHIVISESQGDWVIARLARHLAKFNGWSMDRRPRNDVDANIYFPYIDQKFHTNPAKTLAVGFMTHKEGGQKGRIWTRLAPTFGLRVSMSEMYAKELEKHGPTAHVPVCVELDHFRWKPRPVREKPRIGVAGSVYNSGRKGEGLAERLLAEKGKEWDLVASGKKLGNAGDWPIPTKHYAWDQMPKFYQGLDVFVCTSLIEGGPVTILEALATGRPVVMPIGVGIEQELPHEEGIYRYKKGDYGSMVAAIEQALKCQAAPETLRSYVEDRTPENWAVGWKAVVMEALELSEEEPTEDVPAESWQPLAAQEESESGVYVVAYGQKAHDCAYHLIRTIHKYSPGIPICLVCEGFADKYQKPVKAISKDTGEPFTDEGYCEPLDETFKKILEPGDIVRALPMKDRRARSQKTKIWSIAPENWQYVLYLDADILVSCRLNWIFQVLKDGFDMVLTLSCPSGPLVRHAQRDKYADENNHTNRLLHGNHWLQPAGGVWAFARTEASRLFLEAFHAEWKEWQHTDQQSMIRALYQHPLKAWVLGTEWNTFMHHPDEAPRTAGIRHFATAARAWTVRHDGRSLWRKWSKKL